MSCELSRTHVPRNLTIELHHLIPVAWQLIWQPQVAPFPGTDPDGRGKLWDARTVELCPTHHRNVHAWIVKLMHGGAPSKRSHECGVAQLALQHFTDAGGDLAYLRSAREWGAA